MKEQLQLEEIVGYLPYGIKAVDDFGKARTIDWECQSYTNTIVGLNHVLYSQSVQVNCFKPILFPISSLTEFRKDLGFIPIEYFEIGDDDNDSVEYEHGNIKTIRSLESLSKHGIVNDVQYLPFGVIQKLYEWKIDTHNLIEKGLAISVSEEFNPYK
jgi:hypothetical protein